VLSADVFRQRRLSTETGNQLGLEKRCLPLLAAAKVTDIRAFTSMNPSMTGKRRRLTVSLILELRRWGGHVHR